jgi:hypothetical protein
MKTPWTITITGFIIDEAEVDPTVGAIAALLDEHGHRDVILSALPVAAELAVPLPQPRRRRRTYIGACPECGAQAGLHALSCRHYSAVPEHLSETSLDELRSLPPSQWHGWPADDYDQGLPVVEIRQDHLAALLAEVDSCRSPE